MSAPSLGSLAFVFLLAACAAAQGNPRYFVTDRAIDVDVGAPICVAVDEQDAHGVWWWEPGRDGCARRSTGPGDDAVVTLGAGGTSVRFVMQTHRTPSVPVSLIRAGMHLRRSDGRAGVPVRRRADLKIAEGR